VTVTFIYFILLVSRPQWPRGQSRGSAAARLLGLRVRIPSGACICLLWLLCVVR